MKYHFVVNGFSEDWLDQLGELYGFRKNFLEDIEEGETILFCRTADRAEEIGRFLTEDVNLICSENYLAESILEPLCSFVKEEDLYIFGHDYAGAELSVRVAARKKGSSVVSVHGLVVKEQVIAKKMVYTNHMEGGFHMKYAPYCISVANGTEQVKPKEGKGGKIKLTIDAKEQCFIVNREAEASESAKGLESAKIVVIAGRGAKNKEQVKKLEETAMLLGGELGVSRPAAMSAWAPLQKLVGVSGAMIHPEICITAGVSGAAAFYAGIDKSKFIIAINTDEKASIMKKADIAIVDDFAPVMEALRVMIEKCQGMSK